MLDDAYQQKKKIHGGFITSDALSTAATTVNVGPVLRSSAHSLWVQRIKVYVVTGSAGKTCALADNSGTVALTPALDTATGGVSFTADFGPVGRKLTVNEQVKATISAAGAAVHISIEGYQKV